MRLTNNFGNIIGLEAPNKLAASWTSERLDLLTYSQLHFYIPLRHVATTILAFNLKPTSSQPLTPSTFTFVTCQNLIQSLLLCGRTLYVRRLIPR